MTAMKKNCAALTCFNNSVENPTLTFFPFPSNFELAKRWAIQAGRGDLTKLFTACRRNYLCSEHFELFYFDPGSKKTRFKSGFEPVPTVFKSGSLNNLSTNITSVCVDENKNNESHQTCDLQLDANIANLQTVNVCVNDAFGEYIYSGEVLEEFGVNNGILNEDICHTMDDVCRLCAERFPVADLTSLFDTKIGNKYLNMLLMWLPVKVSRNDGLPQYVCAECGMKLEECSTVLRKFVVVYNKLRVMCNTEQRQNEHYSMPTVTVSKQTESNDNLTSIYTVRNSNTDTENVLLESTNYTWNVINNEYIPELTHLETEQIIQSTTHTVDKIENTPITTTNISNLPIETKNTNKIREKQQRNNILRNKKSKKANILRTKPVKRTPAKQIARKDEEEEEEDQIMYKCSECSKLLPTRDDMFSHCLSLHPVALEGTITCTMIRVTKEMRDNVIDLTTEHLPSTIHNRDDAIVQNNTSSLDGLLTDETVFIDNDSLVLEQDAAGITFNNAPVIVVPVQDVDLTAVDTCLTENILKNILTCVNDLPAVENYSENILTSTQIDTNVAEILPEVSETSTTENTPTAPTNITPIPECKPAEKPNRNFVLNYECSLCFKLLTTKKELIDHCLTVHSLSKQDSVVCKVIKTREKQQYSKKPSNITNMDCHPLGVLPSIVSEVSEKQNISNKQTENNTALATCQFNNSSTENISTVARLNSSPKRYKTELHSKPTLQYRYECPYCDQWISGKIQLIYHCFVHHDLHISDKIICKVERSLVRHDGDTTQVIVRHVQGMIIQDKQPDIDLPEPNFTPVENHTLVANINSPSPDALTKSESQNTENNSSELNNSKYRIMYECAKCEQRFSTKPDLVQHCYVNNCFIGKHKIMCREVKMRVPNREQVQKYECLRCKSVFINKENLIKHNACFHPSAERPAYRVVYRSEQRRRRVMLVNKQIDSADNYRKQVNRRYSWYKCNYCEETFTRIYGFNEHLKTCLKRNIATDPNNELPDVPMIQLELMHTPRRIHESRLCIYCGKVFCNLTRLKVHERIHTNEQPYKCSECSKVFRCSSALAKHKFSHSKELNYICHVCGARYRSQAQLRHHAKQHTKKTERRYICEICNARYTSRSGLQKHKAKHTALTVKHKCTICDKLLTTGAKLEQHIQAKHVNKFRFPCSDCPKVFDRRCRLMMHRNTHTGEKPYLCESCGKTFSNMGARYQHRLIHFAEKRFMCDVCGKRFKRIAHLNAHKLIHTDAKPFQCDICGKGFTYHTSMVQHKRTHEQVVPEPQCNEPQVIVEEVISCDPSDLFILSEL